MRLASDIKAKLIGESENTGYSALRDRTWQSGNMGKGIRSI